MAGFDYIRDYYIKNKGLSDHQARALAANAIWEGRGDPTAVGDGGKAKGVFQWHPDRYANLAAFAKERNADPKNLDTQLDFAHHELTKGTEQNAGGKLLNSSDLTGAHNAVMGYLRPSGYTANAPEKGHGYGGRLAIATGGTGDSMADIDAWGGSTTPFATPAPNIDAEIKDWSGYGQQGLLGRMGDRFTANLDDPKKMAALAASSGAQTTAGLKAMQQPQAGGDGGMPMAQAHQGQAIMPVGQIMNPMAQMGQTQMQPQPGGIPGAMPPGAAVGMPAAPVLTPAQQMLMKMGFGGGGM